MKDNIDQRQDATRSTNVVEQARMPGPLERGEQPGKRTNDERNDPQSQPASREGMPHVPRGHAPDPSRSDAPDPAPSPKTPSK